MKTPPQTSSAWHLIPSIFKKIDNPNSSQRIHQSIFWNKILRLQECGPCSTQEPSLVRFFFYAAVILPALRILTDQHRDTQFSEGKNCPIPDQTWSSSSVNGVVSSVPTNGCSRFENLAVNAPYSGVYQGFSAQDFRLSDGNLESQQQLMGGQFGSDQSQLSHFAKGSFGVEDLQQVPGIVSGSSQFHNPPYGGIFTDCQVGALSFSRLDLARPSSSSFSPFDISAAATSGSNYNLNADTNPFNQAVAGNVDIQYNANCSSANNSTKEFSTKPVQGLGSSENPIEIAEDPENAPNSRLPSSIGDEIRPFPRIFGPSRSISLQPARRGGRKGKRSSLELKDLREARKRGVCIRCRQLKQKVAIS